MYKQYLTLIKINGLFAIKSNNWTKTFPFFFFFETKIYPKED